MAPLRCIDMTSVTSPQQTGRSGADIPGPRGGHGVRLLVLGSDSDAQRLRDQAVAAGYELAQRYSVRVSHVAYGSGIDPDDPRYAKIRDAGLPIVPLQACASELGLGAVLGTGAGAEAAAASGVGSGVVDTMTGERAKDDERTEVAPGPRDDGAVESGSGAGIRDEAARGEAPFGAVAVDELAAEVLEFPAFERLAGSAGGLLPGFDVDFGTGVIEGTEGAEVDAAVDVEPAAPSAVVATDTADEGDEQDEAEDAEELPLGGEVIGADPWLGEATDSDITGYIPQITDTTVALDAVAARLFGKLDVADPAGPADPVAIGAVAPGSAATKAAAATAGTTAAAAAAAADAADAPPSGRRRVTRRFLLSLVWALVPFVSFGLLTPVVFGYAAYRLRSRMLAIAALGYTLAVVLSFALSAARPPAGTPGDTSGTLLTFALAVTWIGGTVHGLSLRTKVFLA